ncbi:MAG: hypothetical protein FWE84_04760 [Firmicutes bacterium]|nr:hypothetical protein [Bacillota bacterium]
MAKKLICLGIAFLMLFSVAGLSACDSFINNGGSPSPGSSLAAYKNSAKAELDDYAQQDNYSSENWEAVLGIVTNGKAKIDEAANKADVDSVATETKNAIDEVLQKGESMIEFPVSLWNHSMGWTEYLLMLKCPDKEITFECSIDVGNFLLRNFSDPLSEMSEEECVEFIIENGVYIPKEYVDLPELGGFVKSIIQRIEEKPYYMFVYGDPENQYFCDSIKATVNDYYETRHSKNAAVKSGDTIYWSDAGGTPNNTTWSGRIAQTYIDMIFKTGDNIIGYAVIEINYDDSKIYTAKLLKSVLCKKVNGEYQYMTEEQAKAAIEEIKK